MPTKTKSIQARRALEALGQNLKTARVKRRISIKGFAERIGVSESTIIRLEKGDDGVSIGTLAMACLVLGEIERISLFLDPGTDDT
jgi:transcriptional regulator with XRE-family HTH domain